MIEIFKEVFVYLKNLFFKEGLRESLTWLLRGSPLILRLAVLLFFFLSVILSVVVMSDISDTNNVMIRALSSPIESAPRPSSAIEALMLASVLPEQSSGGASQQQSPPVIPENTPEFSEELKTLKNTLAASSVEEHSKEQKRGKEKEQGAQKQAADKLYIVNGADASLDLSDLILTDHNDGFLFVPGAILPALADYDLDTFFANKNYESIAQDIAASQKVSANVCGTMREKFSGQDVTHSVLVKDTTPDKIVPRYVQAYLVFRSGVARLCETNVQNTWDKQLDYYAKKFTPRTLLQTRFYFESTVHDGRLYSTSPYVDLGGNGVVETVCNYIPIGQKKQAGNLVQRTDAIFCFDFPLAIDLRSEIQSQITRFGGTATDFVCTDQTGCKRDPSQATVPLPFIARFMSFFYPPTQLKPLEEREINDKFVDARDHATEATFFGDITILGRDPDSGVIKFTVPLGGDKIIAIRFDVKVYQNWRTVWLSLTAASIAITAILALLILADYGLKFREQERAFNAVDLIMSDVPSPYARLDEEGKFLKVNDAFAQLMGYRSAAEATPELRRYTYADFLDDASKELFHLIKIERREGKPYRSYPVQLWTGGRPGVPPLRWIKVHGGDVPTPYTARRKPGQSFGILLPMDPPKPVSVIDQKTVPLSSDVQKTA